MAQIMGYDLDGCEDGIIIDEDCDAILRLTSRWYGNNMRFSAILVAVNNPDEGSSWYEYWHIMRTWLRRRKISSHSTKMVAPTIENNKAFPFLLFLQNEKDDKPFPESLDCAHDGDCCVVLPVELFLERSIVMFK